MSPERALREKFPIEQFAALNAGKLLRHVFIGRVAGVEVSRDKAEALARLDAVHRQVRQSIGMGDWPLVTVEQIHGDKIAVVDSPIESDKQIPGCDGLITNQRGVALGVYMADCCAVYLVDPVLRAIGLVHSGRRGTELGIAGCAIDQMTKRFGSNPADLIVQLSPCIRPPHYETDFAAEIIRQARSRSVEKIRDAGVCTACRLDLYYSYRAERGRTGRMLALLGLEL